MGCGNSKVLPADADSLARLRELEEAQEFQRNEAARLREELEEAQEFQREVEELLDDPTVSKKLEDLNSDDTFVIKAKHLENVIFRGVLDESQEQLTQQLSDYRAKESELAAQLAASQQGRAQLGTQLTTALAGLHGLTPLEARGLALRKGIERACGTTENLRQEIWKLYIPGTYRDARGNRVNYKALKKTVQDALTVCNAILIHGLDSGSYVEGDLTQNQRYILKAAEHLILDPRQGLGHRR